MTDNEHRRNDVSEDIRQDPEFIRGYEAAKKSIERDRSAYSQGWHAAYQEDRELRQKPDNVVTDTITITIEDPRLKELLKISEDLLEMVKKNTEGILQLDERLKKLEKYTEE